MSGKKMRDKIRKPILFKLVTVKTRNLWALRPIFDKHLGVLIKKIQKLTLVFKSL